MNNQKPIRNKEKRFTCYVVFRGRRPGVYKKWADVSKQIDGFKKHYYKGFRSLLEATKALNRYMGGEGKKKQEKSTPKKYTHVWDRNYYENEQIKETPTYYLRSEQKKTTMVEDKTSSGSFLKIVKTK
ncbi:MAG: RNase H1/viroplasmin domain-containing protein [Cyclobacteriaceae bacterium]|nr:RNase H1/viroplasmin domain-containing protein [Cyclobacteriaceae bacterium]